MRGEEESTLSKILSKITRSLAEDDKADLTPYIVTLRALDSHRYFPFCNENKLDQLAELEELESAYLQLAKTLYTHGAVKWFKGREDLAFSPEDFEGLATKAEFSLCVFQILLQKVHASDGLRNFPDVYKRLIRTFCVNSLLLIAEQWDEQFTWSCVPSVQAALKTQECVLEVCSGTLEEILTNPRKESCLSAGLLVPIMTEIQPRLSKTSWKQNPSLKHVYFWLLTNMRSPHVGEHLDLLFPPPLLFLDHHHVENKIIGVKCLQYILAETRSSEIQWYGRADVMYQALQHQLYQHEPELLQEVLPCLVTLLKITELSSSSRQNISQKEDRFDDILPRILSDMETETRILVRREYTKHFSSYIKTLGIRNVKYYKRLLQMISNYLEIYDGPEETTRLNILDILELLIQVTWPRVPAHSMEICKMLVKLLWDIATDTSLTPQYVKDELFQKAESCLLWLRKTSQEPTHEMINSILKIDSIPVKVQESLSRVINCDY